MKLDTPTFLVIISAVLLAAVIGQAIALYAGPAEHDEENL